MKLKTSEIVKWSIILLAIIRLCTLWFPTKAAEEDVVPPSNVRYAYNTLDDSETITTNEVVEIQMKSDDMESGVEEIIYRIVADTTGDVVLEEGVIEGETGSIVIDYDFSGWIEAYAVDYSGNRSGWSKSRKIICEAGIPNVEIIVDGILNGWNSQAVPVHVNVEDFGISAGIESVKCFVNDHLIVNEQLSQADRKAHVETDFILEEEGVAGQGIQVYVETVDWAGNHNANSEVIYIDTTGPQIEMNGIRDGMISGQMIALDIYVSDVGGIRDQRLQVWRIDPQGAQHVYADWGLQDAVTIYYDKNAGEKMAWNLLLKEDGIYRIQVNAVDQAGHSQSMEQEVTIDQTNPVIRYVDQMKGQYVPYFLWNYDVSEMIQDFTPYQYQMTLNGNIYVPGTYVKEDGANLLQVVATDAAGNRSTAEAIFYIDHTAPEIIFDNVKNGQTFQEKMELKIEVMEQGDYLEAIEINSQRVSFTKGSQLFYKTIEEPGTYEVKVRAKDLAGNESENKITFVVEKKTKNAAIKKPVNKVFKRKSVMWNNGKKKDVVGENEKAIQERQVQKSEKSAVVIIILAGVFLVASILIFRFIKYRKI